MELVWGQRFICLENMGLGFNRIGMGTEAVAKIAGNSGGAATLAIEMTGFLDVSAFGTRIDATENSSAH